MGLLRDNICTGKQLHLSIFFCSAFMHVVEYCGSWHLAVFNQQCNVESFRVLSPCTPRSFFILSRDFSKAILRFSWLSWKICLSDLETSTLVEGILGSVLGPSVAHISPPFRWQRVKVMEGAVDLMLKCSFKLLHSAYFCFVTVSTALNFLSLIFLIWKMKVPGN